MGRIKSTFVKRSANEIYSRGQEEFTLSFDENKKIVEKHAKVPSKKLRNTIVGQITRLVKKNSKEA